MLRRFQRRQRIRNSETGRPRNPANRIWVGVGGRYSGFATELPGGADQRLQPEPQAGGGELPTISSRLAIRACGLLSHSYPISLGHAREIFQQSSAYNNQ